MNTKDSVPSLSFNAEGQLRAAIDLNGMMQISNVNDNNGILDFQVPSQSGKMVLIYRFKPMKRELVQ